MKSKINKLIVVKLMLVCGLLFFISNCRKDNSDTPCQSASQNTTAMRTGTCFESMADENQIALGSHIMSQAMGASEIFHFGTSVSTSAAGNLKALADSLDKDSFCPLIDSALARVSGTGGCNDYISALKIYYGLSPDLKRITLLYQPVYYCRTSYDATSHKAIYDLHNPSPDVFYKYTTANNAFVVASIADKTCIDRYKSEILLRHSPSASPSAFDQSDPNGNLQDVEAVIYSFQEIYALIGDNATPYVKVYNAIRRITVDGTVVNKHDLLLAPAEFNSSGTTAGSFLNCYADLAHLCPPSCFPVAFSLQ